MLVSGKFAAWSVFYWCCCSRAANCRVSLVYTLAYHAEYAEHRVQAAWLDQKLVYYICYHLFLLFVYQFHELSSFCALSNQHKVFCRIQIVGQISQDNRTSCSSVSVQTGNLACHVINTFKSQWQWYKQMGRTERTWRATRPTQVWFK